MPALPPLYIFAGILLFTTSATICYCLVRMNRLYAHKKITLAQVNLIDLLKDIQRVSRQQYSVATDYVKSLSKQSQNNVTGFQSALFLPRCAIEPVTYFPELIATFKKNMPLKGYAKLFQLLDGIRYRYNILQEFICRYANEVKLNESRYFENIFELSKVHDELRKYMDSSKLNKSQDSDWYNSYLAVFSAWSTAGANKSIDVTYREIIVRIIALNKLHDRIPFLTQTTVHAFNCDVAYANVLALNKELESRIGSYAYWYKLLYRITRLILRKSSDKTSEEIFVPEKKIRKMRHFIFALVALLLISVAMICYSVISSEKNQGNNVFTFEKQKNNFSSAKTSVKDTTDKHKIARENTSGESNDFSILFDSSSMAKPQVYGLDISKYQGKLIEEVQNLDSIHFLICKATEGASGIDPDFTSNWNFIKRKKYIRGTYHFFHSEDPPNDQAELFLKTVGILDSTNIPPIVDVEEGSLRGKVNIASLDSSLFQFLTCIQRKTNRTPVIYSNFAFANKYLIDSAFSNYPLWLAEYSHKRVPSIPKVWQKKGYVIWQRSDSYQLGSTKTDFDIFNGDGKALMNFIKNN